MMYCTDRAADRSRVENFFNLGGGDPLCTLHRAEPKDWTVMLHARGIWELPCTTFIRYTPATQAADCTGEGPFILFDGWAQLNNLPGAECKSLGMSLGDVVAFWDVVALGDVMAHLIFYYRKMRYNIEWHMHMKRTKAVIRRICNNMRKSKMEIIIGTQKWAKADEAATRSVHQLQNRR